MPAMDPKVLAAMDAPLIELANKSGGDLRQLLHAFFSFLNRRTDFYMVPNEEDVEEGVPLQMGFREGDAEKVLLAAFRQFPLRRMPRKGSGGGISKDDSSKKASSDDGTSKEETQPSTETDTSPSKNAASNNDTAKEAHAAKLAEKKKDPADEIRLTEEGLQVPVGNGGATTSYTWTQTIDETSVLVSVPEGTKGKDLSVSIKSSAVSVRTKKPLKGEDSPRTLLEGDLVDKIRTDESTWSLEGGVLVLTLDKLKKTWWETVLVGDNKIDTTLVDSRRRIDEYDGATQAAIRKIMFDQRQERLGLPTSDEIQGTLPKGVEYIDNATLDRYEKESK